jgi:hypothetical protein
MGERVMGDDAVPLGEMEADQLEVLDERGRDLLMEADQDVFGYDLSDGEHYSPDDNDEAAYDEDEDDESVYRDESSEDYAAEEGDDEALNEEEAGLKAREEEELANSIISSIQSALPNALPLERPQDSRPAAVRMTDLGYRISQMVILRQREETLAGPADVLGHDEAGEAKDVLLERHIQGRRKNKTVCAGCRRLPADACCRACGAGPRASTWALASRRRRSWRPTWPS